MRKRSVTIFFVSLLIFFGAYLYGQNIIAGLASDKDKIDGEILGEGNVIEQNVEDEYVFALLGVDRKTSEEDNQRTDTIMVCKINFEEGSLKILSVPRDTMVEIDGEDHKINAAHAYGGSSGSMRALRNLLGVDIDYYVEVSFDAVRNIVECIGGVEVDSPVEIDVPQAGVHIPKGVSILNGEEALQYVRARHPFGGSDDARIANQHYFLKTLMDQILSPTNITKIPQFIEIFKRDVKTNLPMEEMLRHTKDLTNFSSDNMKSYTLPGYYDDGSGISWYIADEDGLNEIVNQVFFDYKLQASDYSPKTY